MPENQSPEAKRIRQSADATGILLLVLFSPFLLPVFILYLCSELILRIAIVLLWTTRGIRSLFVYSNSPNWQEYIEANVLPYLSKSTVVLNWSERSVWPRWSIAVWVFRHYGGDEDFNPLGVVVPPFGKARIYRFRKPFREFKHGKPAKINKLQREFLDDVGVASQIVGNRN